MRISAEAIMRWTDTGEARAHLPELIRRLIWATTSGLTELDFPSGIKGSQKHGADGLVTCHEANPWVPQGRSLWEFGTGEDPKKKASEDYVARTEKPLSYVDVAETTFVFVTTRRWEGKHDWAEAKAKEEKWRGVKAFDADSLEQWLETAMAPRAWLAERLRIPTEITDLGRFCDERTQELRLPIPGSDRLVLAGREELAKEFVDWLNSPARLFGIRADDPAEAAELLHTALREPSRSDRLLSRAVVVREDEVLRRLNHEEPQVIVALDCSVACARLAVHDGHHVLLATRTGFGDEIIDLPPLDPRRAQLMLERMSDLPLAKASAWAHDMFVQSRGSLSVLRRLAFGAAQVELDDDLVPLLLVDGWNESNEQDLAAVAKITGVSNLREIVRRHSRGPNPYFREGPPRSWIGRKEAWDRGFRRLESVDIQRLRSNVVDVVSGDGCDYSSSLRSGLLETLLLLGVSSANEYQNEIEHIVYDLSNPASINRHPEIHALLAEVAPSAYIEIMRRRWREYDRASAITHALAVLAWSEKHFHDAIDVLAEIATCGDSGGVHATQLLAAIFASSETSVPDEVRAKGLQRIFHTRPGVGVVVGLEIIGPYARRERPRPRRRPWTNDISSFDSGRHIPVEEVATLLVDHIEHAPTRWPKLVQSLGRLPPEPRKAALKVLSSHRPTGDTEREALHAAIRNQVELSRQFPDTVWAYDAATIALFESIVPPPPELQRMFSHDPMLHDWDPNELRDARHRVLCQSGRDLGDLVGLAAEVENVFQLGASLSDLLTDHASAEALLTAAKTSPHSRGLLQGIAAGLVRLQSPLIDYVLTTLLVEPTKRAEFALGLGWSAATWDRIAQFGPETVETYWRITVPYEPPPDDLVRALRELLAVGRVVAAMRMSVRRAKSLDSRVIIELLDHDPSVLERDDPNGQPVSLPSYCIQTLLGRLASAVSVENEELRRLEWNWLEQLDWPYMPVGLHRRLATSPEYFVELVMLADQATGQDPSQRERARRVLDTWSLPLDGLSGWIERVRKLAREKHVSEPVEEHIGEVLLLRSPIGDDGRWPHEAVRAVLEDVHMSHHLESGMLSALGVRGNVGDAVKQYEDEDFESRWPTMAKLLRDHGESMDRMAATSRDQAKGTPVIDTRDRVEQFLDDLQSRGRLSFTIDEIVKGTRDHETMIQWTLTDLVRQAKLFSTEDGFYAIVQPKHRKIGAPPPSDVISNATSPTSKPTHDF